MTRLALLAAIAALCFSAHTARAYIGESAHEVDLRYGPPVKITRYNLPRFQGQERVYLHGDMKIIATFWGGTSHREIYERRRPWRDAEVHAITNANSGRFGVRVLSTSPTRVTWIFGENLYAAYNIRRGGTSFLTVSTGELARAESIRTREEWFWRY